MSRNFILKVVIVPVLILALLGPILAPFAQSFNFPDRYDLVAILVEQSLYADSKDYDGLSNQIAGLISPTTLKARIDRYAIDIQNALPATRAIIVQVDRFASPENISRVLERLYFEGDPKEPTRVAYLKGAVIVGEVPLPVVTKNGERFISLFPYTDFEQPLYSWNSATNDFEFAADIDNPQPEIWHGVIRPPQPLSTEAGKQMLSSYFDKNHLYHIGEPAFTQFAKRVFFQDFKNERKNLNPDAYKQYLKFLEHQGDIAYLRYTNQLYNELSADIKAEMEQDESETAQLTSQLESAGVTFDSNIPSEPLPAEFSETQQPSNAPPEIPDIMTKISKMSDNLMRRFNQLFTKYPNLINDFINYTGRYTGVDSAVNLITAKDQFTLSYLKEVNERIEKKIDEVVASIQKDVPIGEATLTINKVWKKTEDGLEEVGGSPLPKLFVNYSPAFVVDTNPYPDLLNGYELDELADASQCSPYRGSKGIGKNSKLVEINRALNMQSASEYDDDAGAITGRTNDEQARNYKCYEGLKGGDCEGYEHFAGCFFDNQGKLFEEPPPKLGRPACFPEHATDPVFDAAGTREVTGAPPQDFDNFRACFDFHEKENFMKYLEFADFVLEKLDDDYEDDRGEKLSAINSAIGQFLFQNPQLTKAPVRDEDPNEMIIFSGGATLKLGDVLRAFGWNGDMPFGAWRSPLAQILGNPTTTVIDLPHAEIGRVEYEVTHTAKKSMPSIFFHKEPTIETLNAQAKSLISKALPVDNPRYVTFQNQNGEVSRVNYPDIFSEESFENYINNLKEIESSLPCANCLTPLLTDAEKIKDSLDWKSLDIDSKHKYMIERYLDPVKTAYVGESPEGYELLYFNGDGAFDHYAFSFNPVFAAPAPAPSLPPQEEPYQDDPKNPFDDPPKDEGGYDLFSFSPPPVSPWWERMKEWSADLKETTTDFIFGKLQGEFYGDLEQKNKKLLEDIKRQSSEIEHDPAGADEVDFSKIAGIGLETDSTTVAVGKRIEVRVILKDKEGQIVADEFARVTLSLSNGSLSTGGDEEAKAQLNNNQITIMSGVGTVEILTADPAALTLTAQLDGSNISSTLKFSVVKTARLELQTETLATTADGTNEIAVNIFAWDENKQLIPSANGDISIMLSDPLLGRLKEQQVELVNGKGAFHIIAGKKTGVLAVNATNAAFDSGQLKIELLPGPPASIGLSADASSLPVEPGASLQLQATLFDANGNAVISNSNTIVNFRLTEATKRFGALGSSDEKVSNGIATVTLAAAKETGTVNIVAESPGLQPASLTISAEKRFDYQTLMQMQPEGLVAALLGIPAGAVSRENYLGGWFVMNGKVQAVTTLTASPKRYKKLFEINDRGGLRMEDPAGISARFLPANNLTLAFRDNESGSDLGVLTLMALKDSKFDVTETDDPSTLPDGIYMKKLSPAVEIEVDRTKGALRMAKGGVDKIEVQTNGFTQIFDNDFELRPAIGEFLAIDVFERGAEAPVARIFYIQRFNQNIKMGSAAPVVPGVYFAPGKTPQFISHQPSFAGNSSSQPQGIAFYDMREAEEISYDFGFGFGENNKFALLFASGEMFGEANRFYASDAGIVLGDPTVRGQKTPAESGNFTQDVGKLLYAAGSDVRGLLGFDYNTDDLEDILIVQEDGKIRLFQNYGGIDKLKDQGFILNIKSGIQDFTKVDVNNDGQMDLVIAGFNSCRKGDTCVDVYENQQGSFVRKNLQFDQKEKVVTVRTEDLNLDGFSDLVLADAAGDIKILYNKEGVFETQAQTIGNVGLKVDPAKNLISSVLLRYAGAPTPNPDDPVSRLNFEKIAQSDFIYADLDNIFGASTKFGEDLNGGVAKAGDRIRYAITLKNASSAQKNNVAVSDVISEQVEFDPASVSCSDCGADELKVEPLSGDSTRPYLFRLPKIPAKSSREITYEVIFKGTADASDKIKIAFSLNNEFNPDDFPDLSVTKEGNITGRVRYYYSVGVDEQGHVQFGSQLSQPPAPVTTQSLEQTLGINFPEPGDFGEVKVRCKLPPPQNITVTLKESECKAIPGAIVGRLAGPPDKLGESLQSLQNNDSDGDGLQDSIDDLNTGLDDVAAATEKAIDKLTCDAGCIALPLNLAYFTPGFWSMFGEPGGYDFGLPVFGWGAPSLVPVWSPTPYQGTGGGRFYVSPTLTGGVGFGFCWGLFVPFAPQKNCISFGVSPLDLISPGVCDKLNSVTSAALAKANDVVSSANEGMTLTLDGKGGTTGVGARRAQGSGLGNYSLGSYESPVSRSRNIRIPGFPSVIADWISAQWEEISDKALAIPDLYVIYPSGSSLAGSVLPTEEFSRTGNLLTNVLSWINSIPLIDIETQEVVFKVPIITRKEIERLKTDWRQWKEDEKLELDKWANLMGCFGISKKRGETLANPELCRFVSLEMNKLISSIDANIKALDEWILFPKKILQFRAVESYYLGQIVDYLDTIIAFTGGWIKRNTAIIKQWRRSIRQMKDVLENWKVLVQLMVDYNATCDQCTSERYSLMELVLKFFIALPSIPVIPIPKLPDVIIDVSKVQAGVRVQFPDVKFKPEPLTIPKIPRISLGVNLTVPLFKAMIPAIPVLPPPPQLPTLPALPPLTLGKLPNLPPPPTLPGLPGSLTASVSILKKILKIYCLIKLGLIPTDETVLKQRIEQITARPLSPLLPIDLLFTIQSPTITTTYVDQLIATGFTNLQFDLSYVQDAVEDAAKNANSFTTDFTKGINRYTDALSKQVEKITSPTIDIGIPGPEGRQLNMEPSKKEDEFIRNGVLLREVMKSLEKSKKEYEKIVANMPKALVSDAVSLRDPMYVGTKQSRLLQSFHSFAMTSYDEALPFQKRLRDYRNRIASYLQDTKRLLAADARNEDLAELGRYLAQERSAFADKSLKRYVAEVNRSEQKRIEAGRWESKGPVKIGKFDVENTRLLAYEVPKPPAIQLPDGQTIEHGEIRDIGLFYIDTNGESKRLINYTLEANLPSRLADVDLDNDEDAEKVYSYGSNVFIKENHRNAPSQDAIHFRPVDIEFFTLAEILPKAASPRLPRSMAESAHEASFTFSPPSIANLAGFEVISKNSPAYFEMPAGQSVWRTHLLPDAAAPSAALDQTLKLKNPEGDILINNGPPVNEPSSNALSAKIGDGIQTGENSSMILEASDGTTISVGENSGFMLTQAGTFELTQGSIEINLPANGSLLFPAGTVFKTGEDANIQLRIFKGSEVQSEIKIDAPGSSFALPDAKPLYASVKSIAGSAQFTGLKREFIQSASGKVRVAAGEILHALGTSRISWNAGQPGERLITLSQNMLFTVPDEFAAAGMEIEVDEGVIEIIRSEKTSQPVAAGMALLFDDKITVSTGNVNIHYERGGDTRLKFNETYVLRKAEDLSNPAATLEVDPAFYFTKMYAFDADGNRSNSSETLLLAPQICGDTGAPFAKLSSAEYEIAVGKTLELDAGRSFDTMSNVISYQLDNSEPQASPILTIGPYGEIGEHHMRLTVRDEALNEGYQDILVRVVTPRIVLEKEPLRNNEIAGFVEPIESNVPITVARLRPGPQSTGWEILKTPSADSGGQYYTNADGKFRVTDLDTRDRLVVRNHEGKIIAEINPKTGRITILDDRYEIRVIAAIGPDFSTRPSDSSAKQLMRPEGATLRVGIFTKTDSSLDNPLTFVYFVPDVNVDVALDADEIKYDAQALVSMNGVHVKPLDDSVHFKVRPADDSEFPGAVLAEKDGVRVLVIDVNGNLIPDQSLAAFIKLQEKAPRDREAEPVVFELFYVDKLIAEIFIAPLKNPDDRLQLINEPQFPGRPKPVPRAKAEHPFTDIAAGDPFGKIAANLYERGIIAGYPSKSSTGGGAAGAPGELNYKPENLINRAEFTQITLKMLCIIPREEAHKLPSPFYDVLDSKLWFYPVLKEGNIRGFIRGYLGEAKTDTTTGAITTPFKPANNITRAEATTVVLAALFEEDIIDLSNVNLQVEDGHPWYEPYIKVAQDIKPYLKNPAEASERSFLITPEEANAPNELITRRDFAIMADRVLLIYDCYQVDSDRDGLPDSWEQKYGKQPHELGPDEDPDADQCTNKKEYEIGTDPFNADTDAGGVADCVEVNRDTNPLTPYDDLPQQTGLPFAEEGIFALRPACNACPCRATITPGADLQLSDIIFAAITGPNGLPIYAKSNEEKY